jgi:hypothetical protein
MSLTRAGRDALSLATLLMLGGCGGLTISCPDWVYGVDPDTRTLGVGESYTPRAYARGCGGEVSNPLTGSWAVEDSAVARIDRTNGRTTALHSGSTRIVFVAPDTIVAYPLYGQVTVR